MECSPGDIKHGNSSAANFFAAIQSSELISTVECFPVCTVDGVYGISLDQGKGFTGGDAMFFVARCM